MSSRYLVTGGAGFIGSHIAEALVKQGEPVRVLDNFATGKRENIEPFLGQLELVEGDLRNLDDVRKAVKGVEVVLHQGALPSVPISVEDVKYTSSSGSGRRFPVIRARVILPSANSFRASLTKPALLSSP